MEENIIEYQRPDGEKGNLVTMRIKCGFCGKWHTIYCDHKI